MFQHSFNFTNGKSMLEFAFWLCIGIVAYTFAGYFVLLFILVRVKLWFTSKRDVPSDPEEWPDVCLFVTAYNEADCVKAKVANSFELDYPADKLSFLWVTDGSTDQTNELLRAYPEIQLEFEPERRGKVHAMNRGMQFVNSSIVVFTDSNTLLNPQAIKNLVRHFQQDEVACVAGEKRVLKADGGNMAAAGENMYWNLESFVKQWESELSSVVGAAGELFALRREYFQPAADNCLLDDFHLSMGVVLKGKRVVYEPQALAFEGGSSSVSEELKRKIRIAAGGMQALVQLPALHNPFQCAWLSFQYLSHKVLRWTLAPWALFAVFPLSAFLAFSSTDNNISGFYLLVFVLQFVWYLFAFVGFMREGRSRSNKMMWIPYYFTAINGATIMGQFRFLSGRQQVLWQKARRV